jgi:RimJ/RimL family protein N-acetyltransferase
MSLAPAPDDRSEELSDLKHQARKLAPVSGQPDAQEDKIGALDALIVETRRLLLRRPKCADANALATLANDVHLAENLGNLPHPYGIEDARVFIENTEVTMTRVNFGIYLKRAGGADFVGTISLMPRDGEKFTIGYWIGRPYWGDGLATEAARAMVDLAFQRLDAPAVAGSARVTNGASRRVMEKCGFQYVGQGMGPSLFLRGMVPVDRFRLERSVWQSLKEWREASFGDGSLSGSEGLERTA